MKILKFILLAGFSSALSIGVVYLLQMFLNTSGIKVLTLIVIFTGIILIIVSIVGALKNDNKKKNIKTPLNTFLFITSICLIVTGVFRISVYNLAMHEVFGEDLTLSQKMESKKLLKQYNKDRKKYEEDIVLYIKDLNGDVINDITLYYNGKIDREYVDAVKESVPKAEELIEKIYGEMEKEPLKVIFYNEEDWNKLTHINTELVQGFFDGENIFMKGFLKDQPLTDIKENFIHEYSHYAMDMYRYQHNILSSVPLWFNEGVAEYISLYDKNRTYSLDYLRYPIDLRELDNDDNFWNSLEEGIEGEKFYDPYMYSYYMIDSLTDLKGEEIIPSIILKSKEMDFYQAFEEEAGVSIEEYQRVNLDEYVKRKINK